MPAMACARDCQMQVARLRPVTGWGVPYQYMMSPPLLTASSCAFLSAS